MPKQKPIKLVKFTDSDNFDPKQYIRVLDKDLINLFQFTDNLPPTYGNMFLNNGNITVAVAVTDTYYAVGSTMFGGNCLGFTFQNNKELLCKFGGTYFADWSMSLNCSTNNQDIEGAIMINNTAQMTTTSHAFNGAGISKNVAISGNGVLNLKANDLVRVSVDNHTGPNNIVAEHVNLSIFRLG